MTSKTKSLSILTLFIALFVAIASFGIMSKTTSVFADGTNAGTITPCYTRGDGFWGEGSGPATESFVVELYEDSVKIASASLNNIGGIIDGDVYVTWSIPFAGSTGEYWAVEWAKGYPKYDMNPDTVKLVVDGADAAQNAVQWNGPDNLNKIVALAEGFTGGVVAYTNLSDAIGEFNGRKVNVLRDVSESIEGFNGCTLTTNVKGGVTITNAFTDDWVDFNEVTIAKGVTVNSSYIYSGSGSAGEIANVVEGVLNVNETYYHGYGAKTIVQNGGKISVTGSTILRYNEESDAGLYIYGDGDSSTVEFSCTYYIGAYTGTFYAEKATVEAGYFLLDNTYDSEAGYTSGIKLALDDATIKTVGTTDGQTQFKADGEDGKDGVNGVAGVNGKDGVNGINGVDGKNGKDGQEYKGITITSIVIGSIALISNIILFAFLFIKKR